MLAKKNRRESALEQQNGTDPAPVRFPFGTILDHPIKLDERCSQWKVLQMEYCSFVRSYWQNEKVTDYLSI
jgi:hypothetical protein